MTDYTLIEKQKSNEVFVFSKADSAKRSQLRMQIDSHQEYNLRYGQDALVEIMDVVSNRLKEMASEANHHTSQFYWNYVRPMQDAGEKIEETVASVVAINLVATLSRETTLTSAATKMTKNMFHILNIPYEQRDELQPATIGFFGKMITLVSHRTQIFSVEQSSGRELRLYLSPQWDQHIRESLDEYKTTVSGYEPMIVKPTKHYNLYSGDAGYLISESPLMKRPFKKKGAIHETIKEFNRKNNPEFFAYVDKIQDTAYCVNIKLLEALKSYYEKGMAFKDFPISPDFDVVQENAQKEIDRRNKSRKGYATFKGTEYTPLAEDTEKRVYKTHENTEVEKVRKTQALLEQAEDYAGFKEIYYPIFFDSRGRMYPYASGCLSYQGDEMSKALLQFADKEAFTKEGLEAMFETLANALGMDKVERSTKTAKAKLWFVKHLKMFLSGDFSLFFTNQEDFDEPITALAIVLELVEVSKDKDYKSGYIAHRDARVSGSSIIGTAMKDRRVMELTSVIDYFENDRLGDAYTEAAKAAETLCERLAEEGNTYAKDLLEIRSELFTRAVFKHVVMTKVSYGLTDYSLREYNKALLDWEEVATKKHKQLFDEIMLEALVNAIPCCSRYLDVLTAAGKVLSKRDGLVSFINPFSSFPVVFSAKKEEIKRIELRQPFKIIKLSIKHKTDKIDTRAITNAMAPNTTHSLDASLLYLVAGQCEHNLSMIHDSIGSHPNYVGDTVQAYANAMYRVANEDPFNQILSQFGVGLYLEPINTATDDDVYSIPDATHILV